MTWSPSTTSSSSPVTVTSWALFQVSGVNVSSVTSVEASSEPARSTVMVTGEVGSVLSTTDTTSTEPASDTTVDPSLCETVTPAVSSSVVVTSTTRASMASYLLSALAGVKVTVEA